MAPLSSKSHKRLFIAILIFAIIGAITILAGSTAAIIMIFAKLIGLL